MKFNPSYIYGYSCTCMKCFKVWNNLQSDAWLCLEKVWREQVDSPVCGVHVHSAWMHRILWLGALIIGILPWIFFLNVYRSYFQPNTSTRDHENRTTASYTGFLHKISSLGQLPRHTSHVGGFVHPLCVCMGRNLATLLYCLFTMLTGWICHTYDCLDKCF